MIAQLTPKPSADLGKLQDKIEWLIFSGVRDREQLIDILGKQWRIDLIAAAIDDLLVGRRIYPKPIHGNTYYLQKKISDAIRALEGRKARKGKKSAHPLAVWAAEQIAKETAAKCKAEDLKAPSIFHDRNIKHYQWLIQLVTEQPGFFSTWCEPIKSLQRHMLNTNRALDGMKVVSCDYSRQRQEAQAVGDWEAAGTLAAKHSSYRQRMEVVRTRLDRVRYILSLH